MGHIFISYSHTDSDYAHRLAEALEQRGLSMWIDDRVDYGTQWPHVIQEHVDGCSALIVVMTQRAYESEWVQSELARAKRKGKHIFPLLLEGDEPWLSVETTQYVDVRGGKMPQPRFFERLAQVMGAGVTPATGRIGLEGTLTAAHIRRFGGIEFVRVPKGKFVMGSKDDNELAFDDENPQHTVEIPYDYWIARYPLTNDQFAAFVEATKHMTMAEKEGGSSPTRGGYVKGIDWRHPLDPKSGLKDKGGHPVVQVSWYDAAEYCKWLSENLRGEIGGLGIRLPSEAEWEKAARGEYGNEWPWGNEFDSAKCNSSEGGKRGTTPVGAYSPQGDSPYGAADMVGNVWEWCHSLFKPYPYKADDGRESETGSAARVWRGGAFYGNQWVARAAARGRYNPDGRFRLVGLRLVVAPRLS